MKASYSTNDVHARSAFTVDATGAYGSSCRGCIRLYVPEFQERHENQLLHFHPAAKKRQRIVASLLDLLKLLQVISTTCMYVNQCVRLR